MNDLKFAFRQLLKNPGFTAVAVLTLALGIGANTAVFTVVNGVLLTPLPLPESDRLVSLWELSSRSGVNQTPASAPNFVDWHRELKSFQALACWTPSAFNLGAEGGPPERHPGASVSEDFFQVTGIAPALGSMFTAEHFEPGKDGVIVIGHGVWQERFAGDNAIVGKSITVNGRSRVIVGVMPPKFQSPNQARFWVPKVFTGQQLSDRNYKHLVVLGRLADGATVEQARAEVAALASALEKQYPDSMAGWTATANSALADVVKPVRPALLVLLAAVGTVLLMACVNVANLLLARGATRLGELSVRAALGASRQRLLRQLVIESIPLVLIGGLAGVLVAHWLLSVLLALAPAGLPRFDQVKLDLTALGFTFAVCVLAGLFFGVAPAMQFSAASPLDALKGSGQRGSMRVGWLRRGLVTFQVAAALVVLVGTGLLLRSFEHLLRVDLGFVPESLLTVRLELPPARYASEGRRDVFAEELLRRLAAVPGVESAAASSYLPLQGWPQFITRIEGRPAPAPAEAPATGYTAVSESFFHTLGLTVQQGRNFNGNDRENQPRVTIVNRAFARRFFGETDPIGQRIEIGFADPPRWLEIVGVVNDARNATLEAEPKDQVFVPLRQQSGFLRGGSALSVAVRTKPGATGLAEALRETVWSIDKDQPLHNLKPMTQVLSEMAAQRRFTVMVLNAFAGIALLLAAVGLYGVMSHAVSARTREIGIRMALGAQRRQMLGLILRSGAKTLALGLAGGLVLAIASAWWMKSLLFETQPLDPLTYAAVIILLTIVSLAACWLPAHRASRVEPMEALRHE